MSNENGLNEKWQLIPKGKYYVIKNAETGELLHNENQTGYVEHGKVPETYYSEQWKKISIDGYVRLVNRWKPTQVINTEHNLGYLEVSDLQETAWSSQWLIE